MSGTDDFAYSAFKSQIEAMAEVSDKTFVIADNEQDGNLAFREQEGGTHDGNYASQYTYNGLMWFWSGENRQEKRFIFPFILRRKLERMPPKQIPGCFILAEILGNHLPL